MNLDLFKQQLIAHYVAMAELPGWKAQAWHSVNDLADRFPSEFKDLPGLLVAEMRSVLKPMEAKKKC